VSAAIVEVMSIDKHTVSNLLVMGKSGAGKQPRIDVLVDAFELKQLSTGDMFRYYLKSFDAIDFEGKVDQFYDSKTESFCDNDKILHELGPVASWDNPNAVLLGLKAKYFVESGKFVPDTVTNAMFESEFLKNGCKGMVLDGFPRTVPQAELLLDLVIQGGSNIDAIVLVESDDSAIVQRTIGRRICPDCKKVYHVEYKPPAEGDLCTVCGARVIHRVDDKEEKIRSRLEEFKVKTEPAIKFLKTQGIPVAVVPGNLPVFTEEAVRESVMSALKGLL
jgi:adenylate kinase